MLILTCSGFKSSTPAGGDDVGSDRDTRRVRYIREDYGRALGSKHPRLNSALAAARACDQCNFPSQSSYCGGHAVSVWVCSQITAVAPPSTGMMAPVT